jgi:asparaginyl-tRNA synthetase
MLEGEVVLDTLEQLMDVVEDGIRSVLTKMLGDGKRAEGFKRDLGVLAEGQEDGMGHLRGTAGKAFHRLTYSDAIRVLIQQHEVQPFESRPDWNEGLPTEQEKWLAGKYGPTFITHYPKHMKPFYMLSSSADPLPPLPLHHQMKRRCHVSISYFPVLENWQVDQWGNIVYPSWKWLWKLMDWIKKLMAGTWI